MHTYGTRLTWALLVELVGPDGAEALAKWQGHRVPTRPPHTRTERFRRILAAIDAGESYAAVAEREQVSRQRVAQIVRFARFDP